MRSFYALNHNKQVHRDLCHLAVIKSNDKSAQVRISAKVGGNYYGGSRVIIMGF